MEEYVIGRGGEKSRAFVTTCVAVAVARELFLEAQTGDTVRPLWAMFAGTDSSLRAFVANIRTGRKAEPAKGNGFGRRASSEDRLEFLKTVHYQVTWQRESEGSIATVYHPDLFRLDPGGMVDHATISFAAFVPDHWLLEQKPPDVAAAVRHVEGLSTSGRLEYAIDGDLAPLVPTASLFAAYLDRRTRCPIVPDARFHLQLLIASLDAGLASFPGDDVKRRRSVDKWGVGRHGFNASGLAEAGICHALVFHSQTAIFESLLAEQTSSFLGSTR